VIRVLLHSSIYVPTVFSPNGDGVNDLLAPITDPSITEIQYFEIFSRWGELIYSEKDFVPNQGDIGWDGTSHGEKMQPGVFVYRLGAVNKRGRIYDLYGDLTLIR
jgi:gliding motility-associated-like protein